MNKRDIVRLVLASYNSSGQLDNARVSKNADTLSRSELKKYISALTMMEKKTHIYVETKGEVQDQLMTQLRSLFPGKHIDAKQNDDLLAGIRIINNDDIIGINLRDTLENLETFITQEYD